MNRMTRAFQVSTLLMTLTAAAALADHQPSQAPKEGDMAVSGNLGLAGAFDSNFDEREALFTGTFEYYTSPRVSWRGLLGFTSFDADEPRDASIDYTFVNANVLYNWEGGWVHPYITGGVGTYTKDASTGLPRHSDDTEVGANGGGGIDWFVHQRFAIKFEGTFHVLTGEEPKSFFLATAGVKFWF